jgi:hypothetical protein
MGDIPQSLPPKLAAALAAAQAQAGKVMKNGRNDFHHYDYAKLEDHIDALRGVLSTNKLAVLTSVVAVTYLEPRQTKRDGMEYVADAELMLTVVHESGEQWSITAHGQGQDSADKAIYKAITGGRKYGLAMLFNLATSDDPEKEGTGKSETKPAPSPRAKQAATHAATPPLTPAPPEDRSAWWNLIVEFCGGDEAGAGDWLESITTWTPKEGRNAGKEMPGMRDINRIKPGNGWKYVQDRIKAKHENFLREAAAPPTNGQENFAGEEKTLPF